MMDGRNRVLELSLQHEQQSRTPDTLDIHVNVMQDA
jgi:hypothetical protein